MARFGTLQTASMRPIAPPFVLLLLLAGAPPAAPSPGPAGQADASAADMLQAIKEQGAESVLLEIYEDDARWQLVLRGIASGSPGWLEVGERLKRVAREQAEELTVAVARALETQPANALAILGEAFDADDVCSLNTLEESLGPDYAKALSAVERRQRAVARVSDPRLRHQRDECLAFLQELRREVVRNKTTWFQTTSR